MNAEPDFAGVRSIGDNAETRRTETRDRGASGPHLQDWRRHSADQCPPGPALPATVHSKFMRVAETQSRRFHRSGNSLTGSSDSRSPDSGKRGARGASPPPASCESPAVPCGDQGCSYIPSCPSREGYFGRERPPQGVLRRCKLRHTPAPAPGRKKGGSLPSTSAFPVRARRSRECGRNCMSDKEIGKIGGVSQKASGMELGSIVSLTLPDRHRTPLFSGQIRPPGSQLERQIPKPAGRTTTADQRSRTDARG